MIVAIDFDGVLHDATVPFPGIGNPNYSMISFTREMIDMGHEVVLWTSRTGQALEDAVDWCGDRGLHFSAINDQAPSNKEKYTAAYPEGTRKVHADIYVDDHNCEFILTQMNAGYNEAIEMTISRLRRILSWKKPEES